jgi:TonB family protein
MKTRNPLPLAAIVLLCVTSLRGQTSATPLVVQPDQAEQNLVKKVAPVYPALAKQVHIQGKVGIRLMISKEGTVASVKVLNGHPLLVQAAIDAVKQWQYNPFEVDGQPVEAQTDIDVPFSLGVPDEEYRKEQQAVDEYFKEAKICRGLVQQKKYDEAEASCRSGAQLAEKLPHDRQNERRMAYELLGHLLFFQQKFGEALDVYRQELAIAQTSLQPYEAELAYAYRDVAHGLYATGDLSQAHSYYERAVNTLEQARDHIGSAFLKNEYAGTEKTLLQEHAKLLRQMGDNTGAEATEQKAQSIVVRTDLKN